MAKQESLGRATLSIFVTWVFILLVWFSSYCISVNAFRFQDGSLGDLSTVLFGAASIALFMLSLFIALLTIFGWQTLQASVRAKVEEATSKEIGLISSATDNRFKLLETELGGRVYSILGFVIGETSIDPETYTAKDIDRLRDAITNSQKGYDLFKEIGGRPGEYLALNNLVFYSCLVGDRSMGSLVLERARLLKAAGQDRQNLNLLLTYCRAVAEFGSDKVEIREAYEIAQGIIESTRSSDREKREAKLYSDSLLSVGGW